jgi:hypothetical protein
MHPAAEVWERRNAIEPQRLEEMQCTHRMSCVLLLLDTGTGDDTNIAHMTPVL